MEQGVENRDVAGVFLVVADGVIKAGNPMREKPLRSGESDRHGCEEGSEPGIATTPVGESPEGKPAEQKKYQLRFYGGGGEQDTGGGRGVGYEKQDCYCQQSGDEEADLLKQQALECGQAAKG